MHSVNHLTTGEREVWRIFQDLASAANGKPVSSRHLAEVAGKRIQYIHNAINALRDLGLVRSPKRGQWELV